jgi:hypothetical protein
MSLSLRRDIAKATFVSPERSSTCLHAAHTCLNGSDSGERNSDRTRATQARRGNGSRPVCRMRPGRDQWRRAARAADNHRGLQGRRVGRFPSHAGPIRSDPAHASRDRRTDPTPHAGWLQVPAVLRYPWGGDRGPTVRSAVTYRRRGGGPRLGSQGSKPCSTFASTFARLRRSAMTSQNLR